MDSPNMYIYVRPADSREVYKYTIQQDKWIQLQNCLYEHCALVVKNNYLLCVGGCISGVPTNKLFQLQQKEWKEYFPNMNTARYLCTAIAVSHYLIVIGGYGHYGPIASVDILDDQTKKWSLLRNLPRPLPLPSATICGQ